MLDLGRGGGERVHPEVMPDQTLEPQVDALFPALSTRTVDMQQQLGPLAPVPWNHIVDHW